LEGIHGGVAKSVAMSPATVTDIERFERVLLRRGVGVLTADRNRCADCGRTPLVGERVHLYEHRGAVVCELCRPRRREDPAATETVRHFERGHGVRLAGLADLRSVA
jgi:recombinational DNA repair protein (RecF pathway)